MTYLNYEKSVFFLIFVFNRKTKCSLTKPAEFFFFRIWDWLNNTTNAVSRHENSLEWFTVFSKDEEDVYTHYFNEKDN